MKSMLKASAFLFIIMIIPFFTIGWIKSCQNKKGNVSNFSGEQIRLIREGNAEEKMQLMNWFVSEDSLLLRKHSTSINFYNDPHLTHLVSRMFETVTDPQNSGVGIAAPQVGILKRIIWVKRYDKAGAPFEVYLNARITTYSDTLVQRPDGCLSIPGISGQSWRAIWVEVSYNTLSGQHVTEKITQQYTAHIFQHEIDHLDGIVWLDRVSQKNQENKHYLINTNKAEEQLVE